MQLSWLVFLSIQSAITNTTDWVAYKLQKWKSEIRVPAWLGGDPPLDRLPVPPHGRTEKRALSGFFYKTINLIHGGSALMT